LTQHLWLERDRGFTGKKITPMPIGLARLAFVNLVFVVISFAVARTAKPQDAGDLYDDSHFREEQGVNEYTAPSIEKLFEMLDSLKPIPDQELARTPQPLRLDNRVKYALSFGALIGDGFLAVEKQDANAIEALGRELLRRAKGLGVQQRVNSHSKQLLELARRSDWPALRKELIVTQKDVENAMLDLRDEELAHLLSLGGWIRGLEIAAASVAADWTPERVAKLRQLDLLDYFLQRLETLSPPLKSTPLISKIIAALKELHEKLASKEPLSKEDASGIRDTAHDLIALIDQRNTPSSVGPRY
jgi:hypothetical protein